MAAPEKDVLNSVCVYCNNRVKNGLKCIKCAVIAHPSCVRRQKNIKLCEGGMICCSETDSSTKHAGMEDITDLIPSITDNFEILEENPLKREIVYLKSIISHKNFIIRELQEKIQTIEKKNEFINNPFNSLYVNANIPSLSETPVEKNTDKSFDLASKSTNISASAKLSISDGKKIDSNSKDNKNITRSIFSSRQVNAAILEAKSQNVINSVQQLEENSKEKDIDIVSDGWSQVNRRKNRKFLVGNTDGPCEVETVPRLVALHVTRLKPATKPEDLKKFLEKSLAGVECHAHASKQPEIYGSMKVIIKRELLKDAWKREVWPNGALVSFFVNRGMSATKLNPQSQGPK